MNDKDSIELDKLKEELKKLKSENKLSEIKVYTDLLKNLLLLIGGIILFITIQKPESIINRQTSEESLARERTKLILEILNSNDPKKIYQSISIIKATYPNSEKWMTNVEKAIMIESKTRISDDIILKYKELMKEKKCYDELMRAEMNGDIIELPCGHTSGFRGYGAITKQLISLTEKKIAELKELVRLYNLDENTLNE